MAASFDAFRYMGYLQSRWRPIAISCGTAVAIAALVSAILPRQYTATARIVIEPPAGTDVRSAVAVSPIYLESLRTYEQFALGDSLFQRAMEKFGLRSGPIESQKRRVLRVSLVRNTRILEISATLPEPRKAQELAYFLAQATIDMSRSLTTDGDTDLIQGMLEQQREVRERLDTINAESAATAAREPVQALEAEAENSAALRAALDRQLSNVGLEIADAAERLARADAAEAADIRKQQSNAKARQAQLRAQLHELDRESAQREKLLEARLTRRERIESDRKAALAQVSAMETQLREARGGARYRGERLRIIDPGIVPERPSSPNLPLNIVAAALLGLALPIVWLTLRMGHDERNTIVRGGRYSVYAKAHDE